MTPARRKDPSRAWKVLARVRWENVALLVAVTVALVALALSGRLAGPGSPDLPADIGLTADAPRPEGKGSGTTDAPMPDRPPPKISPSRRRARPGSGGDRKRRQREERRGKRLMRPVTTIAPQAPPAPLRPLGPQGSEFAPD
jgi:hypothetical protein